MIIIQILATPLMHFLFSKVRRMYFLISGVTGLRKTSFWRTKRAVLLKRQNYFLVFALFRLLHLKIF